MPFFTRSKPTVTPAPIHAYPTEMIAGDLLTILETRYNLISLDEASQRPKVVYHSVGADADFHFVDSAFCESYKSELPGVCVQDVKLERRKAIKYRHGRGGVEVEVAGALARVRALRLASC